MIILLLQIALVLGHRRAGGEVPTPKPTMIYPRSALTSIYQFPPDQQIPSDAVMVLELTTNDRVNESAGEPFRVWRDRSGVLCTAPGFPEWEYRFDMTGKQRPWRIPVHQPVWMPGDLMLVEQRTWVRIDHVWSWWEPLPHCGPIGPASADMALKPVWFIPGPQDGPKVEVCR